jgi:hypothetical protein
MIASVIGRTRCRALAPASASTTMIASGPYATEVSASRESADSPSTGVICSWEASLDRSGRPIRRFQTERLGGSSTVRRAALTVWAAGPTMTAARPRGPRDGRAAR